MSSVKSDRFRIDLNIDELANEMVNRLPDHLFERSDSTFLDPAYAGGQFLYAIAKRLMAHGHTKENILSRLYGVEYRPIYANSFKIRGLLGANLQIISNLKQLPEVYHNMNFDAIVGNPPFQDSTATTTKLWHKFVMQSYDLLKEDGRLVFVTPRAWLERPNSQLSAKMVETVFTTGNLEWVDLTAVDHFNVGENPCAYCVQKSPYQGTTNFKFADRQEQIVYTGQKIAITELDELKIKIFDIIDSKSGPRVITSTYSDTGCADSIEKMLEKKVVSKKKSSNSLPVFWTAANTSEYFMAESKVKKGVKVIINRSGYYYKDSDPDKYILIDQNEQYAIGAGAFGISFKTLTEAQNFVSFMTSTLYRWYVDNEKTSGFNTGIGKLPMLDTMVPWTNDDVFDYFNISADDRDKINGFY